MQRNSNALVWALFLGLGFLWGSSYLWIKIGLETVPPLTLIAGRLVLASIFLWTVVLVTREPLPRSRRQYGHLLVMACVNIVVPFILIAEGERSIDSALASILNATVPLFVIVMAPFFIPEEGITWPKVGGLALGFAGVILLVAPDLVNLSDADFTGEVMLLGSSLFYAMGNVYAKRNVKGLAPRIPALFQVFFAALIIVPLALVIDRPLGTVHPAPEAIFAITWLGILGSGFAYICYFTILANWGATRTSMVAYLLPVVGIALGAAVLNDPITINRVAGALLVIAGIALVNSGPALRRLLDSRADRAQAEGRG
ncbi:MAG: DMT family transporter [Candidatus Limnocylindrales bacterium]